MVRASTNKEARLIHADLLTRTPEGTRLPRTTFLRFVVVSFPDKSLEAAERILKTGEALGLWSRSHDPHLRVAHVHVHATSSTEATAPLGKATPT